MYLSYLCSQKLIVHIYFFFKYHARVNAETNSIDYHRYTANIFYSGNDDTENRKAKTQHLYTIMSSQILIVLSKY